MSEQNAHFSLLGLITIGMSFSLEPLAQMFAALGLEIALEGETIAILFYLSTRQLCWTSTAPCSPGITFGGLDMNKIHHQTS
jgi:hypothetical protein